ncbi:MAG: hypothetical protein FWC85_03550 [Elusimicrobia bacterium]|nr:hypothetical protein [Elusimicrobiota bacterium]
MKVKKISARLKETTAENVKLKAEVEFLRKETRQTGKKLNEYLAFKENARLASVKLERLLKKIDTVKEQ